MIYPSIDKLVNKVESKYTLVSLASKRARQLRENERDIRVDKPISKKYVGIALEEILDAKLLFEKPKVVDR
ncbi:DNA-directed RNA polymerase subunit omega [Ammoniphilus sp. YIM 78166]|uniref:DNA-directed RNA polymerase subunit omega n=1 Tax=Ammoniphilus sp. YIM 78166 TaxID=1644106 RepID=UPI00106F7ED3|nr:DNA-directed RNA polymerase subunit omega [Ammoniphilus sp. YIM 78166]